MERDLVSAHGYGSWPMKTQAILFAGSLVMLSLVSNSRAEWPQYRGPGASGVDSSQPLAISWNVETGENVRWHTPIPGLAHSSPIVAGDRVYVATAVSEKEA